MGRGAVRGVAFRVGQRSPRPGTTTGHHIGHTRRHDACGTQEMILENRPRAEHPTAAARSVSRLVSGPKLAACGRRRWLANFPHHGRFVSPDSMRRCCGSSCCSIRCFCVIGLVLSTVNVNVASIRGSFRASCVRIPHWAIPAPATNQKSDGHGPKAPPLG